jgi:DNA-directed RNA polymerase subunit E'/Rpb7
MDPLFERRELVRNIHLESRFLQRNVDASLLAQLRLKYEGVCVAEGYIQRGSVTIVEHSLGRANFIKGGLDYTLRFQADVCMPHPGQVFRVPVTLKSKIGIHAEVTPIKVLLPRDLHIGNADFDLIEEKQDVEVEVVGARFQQGDESIVVLGKLRQIIQPAAPETPGATTETTEPVIAAPVGSGSGEEVKKVVTVEVGATKSSESKPRPRRIRASVAPEPKV